MARYSSREGRWYGRHGPQRRNVTLPEGSGDAREWRTELPGGAVRIDIGAPIPRLPSEPQPVQVRGGLAQAPEAPREAPAAAPLEAPKAPAVRRREHRAITRD